MTKIFIAEDELNMRKGLQDNLEFEGYEVKCAEDGEEALEQIKKDDYDLIILDVMMPKMSGFDVCKAARKIGIETPIILLTAKGEEIDRVLGLELGADDYVTKPFSLRELLARIKAILRRSENKISSTGVLEKIGNLNVNFTAYTANSNGKEVSLSHKEFEILSYLWKKRNTVVSRDDLLNEVWGYEESPTTRTVDNFILKLRQKIEKDSNNPKIILTVHGVGYKLIS